MDLFGPDGRLPYGIPILWPFSELTVLSSQPLPLLMGVRHIFSTDASPAEWIRGIIDWYNIRAIFREVMLIVPIIILGEWFNRSRYARGVI